MNYSPVIQKSIQYVENHLHEELTLEHVASFAGFSKYHYHRLFQKELGVTISEYIRYRRIASGAQMLIYTDEKIIDIAIHLQFESQEAFTRSFKKYYRLPPGKYRKIMSKIILQKEERYMNYTKEMKGWFLSGSHPHNYQIGVDRKTFHKGNASGYIKSLTVESDNEFGTMMQIFKAESYIGKRMKFSGFLKSDEVTGWCGFWMRVDSKSDDVLQFDNMADRQVKGSSEWNYYSIVLDVPENSGAISFGVILAGKGQVWIDELKFEEVDKNTPVTSIDFSGELQDKPVNLSFEE